ncbi:hypothetical protein M408DRAFT_10595 [Serendipita vermifera MAFF 305830]|uniref:Uncharacterized protein n=1 Tax=Serendipita vermifera MAFF 305830 TaxID=933852 RepID=A0A0C2X7L5_SERVB|nr:hypothetical protein M408DRAFT_10595 [Serendipita vermifera MAFF 305830]
MALTLADYYPANSPEAEAWAHVQKYTHTHLVTASNIAYAARYDALRLFLTGEGVYIPPRNVQEVKELLERHALSYLYTNMSYMRPSPQGSDFSNMKHTAFDGLASLVNQHQRALLSRYQHSPDWDGHPSPPRRAGQIERA